MSSLPSVIDLGPAEEAERLWYGALEAREAADDDFPALCEALEEGRTKVGDTLGFVSFGAGLTWAACSINPQPGRFALHKLLISGRRKEVEKRRKDLAQAASLCWVLLDDDPDELAAAWAALAKRGKKWSTGVRASLSRLDDELAARLATLFD